LGFMVDPTYPGPLLNINIQLIDRRSYYLTGSNIEIWHADADGHYDASGWNYRGRWQVAGPHGAIDVTTALPGILAYNASPRYRHIHLLVQPVGGGPAAGPFHGETGVIEDWKGEILLQLPPWTDPGPVAEDPRSVARLAGPYTHGFG